MTSATARAIVALGAALLLSGAPGPAAGEDLVYDVAYSARIVPTERAAHVAVRVTDPKHLLKQVQWRIDPERHRDFRGDGLIDLDGDLVRWTPEKGVNTLRYVFRIDHLRDELRYDARSAENWAIFRGDDLVPPAKVRTEDGARSSATLRLRLPDGWSVAAPFERDDEGTFVIDNPRRRFDRPTGWLVAGRLGVVRESVAGSRVAVAGPRGQRLRRLDILALLRWTLPSLRELVGELPDRLLVVGAGDPMWRGGLSGPRSVFIHASRPLISEDGTSPVLHELVHSSLALEPGEGGDWIIEGLAELYSLEALARSRTISKKRYARAIEKLKVRGRQARSLEVEHARGPVTARAVTVLYALDDEIRDRTDDQRGLEDAVRVLLESRPKVTTAALQASAERVSGADLSAFFRTRVGPAR